MHTGSPSALSDYNTTADASAMFLYVCTQE